MPRPKKKKSVKYTKLEQDLLEAANAMLAYERDGRSKAIAYNIPDVDVRVIRDDLHLSQEPSCK